MTDYRDISTLHNWEHNPRSMTKDGLERLVKQIKKLGVYKPLLITQDGTVLGGNMRLQALRELGQKEVWVSVVEADTEEKKIEYALSDNDRAGKYEADQLANLIGNFPDVEWNDFTVDIKDPELVTDLMDKFSETEEDEAPPLQEGEAESKLGEVYQLGRHRVMCGDSTKIEDVEKLMDGKKADITFHSPPYNVGHNLGYKNDNKYENYKDDNPEYDTLLNETTNNALNYSRYAFVNLQFLANNKRNIINYLMTFRDVFVDILFWKKSQVQPAMANNVLNSQVECIFVFSNHNQSRAIDTGNFRGNLSNFIETNSNSRNENSDIHNAGFPVEFAHHFVSNFSKESVIDLFMGTGTTLIACEQTNRICYGMELDPKYVDVIRKRYAKFINKENEWLEVTPIAENSEKTV